MSALRINRPLANLPDKAAVKFRFLDFSYRPKAVIREIVFEPIFCKMNYLQRLVGFNFLN